MPLSEKAPASSRDVKRRACSGNDSWMPMLTAVELPTPPINQIRHGIIFLLNFITTNRSGTHKEACMKRRGLKDPQDVASWAGKYPKEKTIVLYCA
jgi:hypothetical protein